MSGSEKATRRSREQLIGEVADVVDMIPRGRVLTYGDIAEIIGTGPRQVGWAMAHGGGATPWWRVVNASGAFPPQHQTEAIARHLEEGTPLRPDKCRVILAKARLSPQEWIALAIKDDAEEFSAFEATAIRRNQ